MPAHKEIAEGLVYADHPIFNFELVTFSGPQIAALKVLLARGLNTWSEAPPELFELAQLLNAPENKG